MESKSNLPNGFITVEEAIELINSDTRANAKVDTSWLVDNLVWIEENHNFRIPLLRNATKEEIEAQIKDRTRRGPVRTTVKTGSVNVEISRAYEAEMLKEAIRVHYRETAGKDFVEPTVRAVSSVADEEKTGGQVNPRSEKPIAQEGTIIGKGETTTTNGANL